MCFEVKKLTEKLVIKGLNETKTKKLQQSKKRIKASEKDNSLDV